MANRAARTAIAAETVEILRRGEYVSPPGRTVSIREPPLRSRGRSSGWLPPAPAGGGQEARFEVANEMTLPLAGATSAGRCYD
jgi:hypothetical protein